MAGRQKLTVALQTYVVQRLACFDSPSEIAAAIRKESGIEITPQSVEAYDPTKKAGTNLAQRWRSMFEEARKAFLDDVSGIAIAHKAVRLRRLDQMEASARGKGNMDMASKLLEQAAKEVGNSYTNRRELSGPGGGAIPVQAVTAEMTPQEAAQAYANTLDGGA